MELVVGGAPEVPEDTFGSVEVQLSWIFSKTIQLYAGVTEVWP